MCISMETIRYLQHLLFAHRETALLNLNRTMQLHAMLRGARHFTANGVAVRRSASNAFLFWRENQTNVSFVRTKIATAFRWVCSTVDGLTLRFGMDLRNYKSFEFIHSSVDGRHSCDGRQLVLDIDGGGGAKSAPSDAPSTPTATSSSAASSTSTTTATTITTTIATTPTSTPVKSSSQGADSKSRQVRSIVVSFEHFFQLTCVCLCLFSMQLCLFDWRATRRCRCVMPPVHSGSATYI
jgi:hypothetical protein